MNISAFFKRGSTMTPTVERTGTDDVLAEIEAAAKDEQRAHAERVARERHETAEHRAKVTAEGEARRRRMHESLDELGDLVPRLLMACAHFTTIATEVGEKGLGFDASAPLEEVLGLPHDFGVKLVAAINELAPRTEWDWGHVGVLGKGVKAERPKLRTAHAPVLTNVYQLDIYGNRVATTQFR